LLALVTVLAVAGGAAEIERAAVVDLGSLAATAQVRSPRIASARLRGEGETLSRKLEQTSPWPSLRAGAKVWPAPTDTMVAGARYRVYVQLRVPLLLLSSSFGNRAIYEASAREGAAATLLARQLMMHDLYIAYAIAQSAQESRRVYADTRAMQEKQVDVLKARLREGAATAAELSLAEEMLQATLAASDEAERAGDEGRERIAALTGVDVSQAYLAAMPEGLAATDGLDAETRARAQRAEVKLRGEEAARYRAQSRVSWRSAIDVDLGAGYAHGTTGSLDELSGVNVFAEIGGPLDGPWRAARDKQRNLAYANSLEQESHAWAEQVAAEAHDAFARWQRARGQARVAEVKVQSLKTEYDRVHSRAGLVPKEGRVATQADINAAESAMRAAQGQMMEMRSQEALQYATLLAAEGTDIPVPGVAPPRHVNANANANVSAKARGLWVWHTRDLVGAEPDAASLRDFIQKRGIGEVYLSWPRGISEDPKLVSFVRALRKAGVRVEALAGEATWYRPERRAPLFERIDEVARFNHEHPDAQVSGIHLDIEPHQLPENKGPQNRAYVPDFVDTLVQARAQAERAHLTLACDIPRKLLQLSADEAATLVAACPHLTLMLYELDLPPVIDAAKVALGWGAQVTVGVRAADFRAGTGEALKKIDAQLGPARGYQGWAVHDYAAYRAAD
jgi:outer membrane protein TolC